MAHWNCNFVLRFLCRISCFITSFCCYIKTDRYLSRHNMKHLSLNLIVAFVVLHIYWWKNVSPISFLALCCLKETYVIFQLLFLIVIFNAIDICHIFVVSCKDAVVNSGRDDEISSKKNNIEKFWIVFEYNFWNLTRVRSSIDPLDSRQAFENCFKFWFELNVNLCSNSLFLNWMSHSQCQSTAKWNVTFCKQNVKI